MIAARELLRPLVQSSRAVHYIDVKNGIFDVYLPIESQDEVGELAHAINGLVSEVNSNSNQQKVMIDKAYRLLEHMMPPVVLARFRRHENMCSSTSIGTDVTLAFIEIMDLDRLFDHVNPDVAIDRYDELIASFDDVVDRHGMEKLGQCGSGIMVASGLINPKLDHTSGVLSFAQELQWVVDTFNAQHLTSVFLNVGVHKGYVSNDKAGRLHFVNELWKRTIELAKEIDSTVHKSGVRVSTAAYENVEVNSEFEFVEDDIVIGEPAWTLLGFSGKQGMLN
jgi:class 3 adenylate cyclase